MRKKKKIMGIVVTLLLVLTCAFAAEASDTSGTKSSIHTQVPSSHTIRIEKKHATVTFEDEEAQDEEGISDTLAVDRFAEPTIQIVAEKGWKIQRILLEDQDITDQFKDGYLTLEPVCEDLTLTIETTEDATGGDKESEKETVKETEKESVRETEKETVRETEKETVKPGAGKNQDNQSSGHQKTQDKPQNQTTAKTGDVSEPMRDLLLMIIAAGLAGIVAVRLRRKS